MKISAHWIFMVVVLFCGNCDDGVCDSNDGPQARTKLPVTTPPWPKGGVSKVNITPGNGRYGGNGSVERQFFPILEDVPELLAMRAPGGGSPVSFGCNSALQPAEYSFIAQYAGECDGGELYIETFGTTNVANSSMGRSNCRSNDYDLIRSFGEITNHGSEQMILCGDPVVASITGTVTGGVIEREIPDLESPYAVTIYVTIRQWIHESGQTYRILLLTQDEFPWIGSRSNVINLECGQYIPSLEILTNWNRTLDTT